MSDQRSIKQNSADPASFLSSLRSRSLQNKCPRAPGAGRKDHWPRATPGRAFPISYRRPFPSACCLVWLSRSPLPPTPGPVIPRSPNPPANAQETLFVTTQRPRRTKSDQIDILVAASLSCCVQESSSGELCKMSSGELASAIQALEHWRWATLFSVPPLVVSCGLICRQKKQPAVRDGRRERLHYSGNACCIMEQSIHTSAHKCFSRSGRSLSSAYMLISLAGRVRHAPSSRPK